MRRSSELSSVRSRFDQFLARIRPDSSDRGAVRSDPGRGGAVAMLVVALLVAVLVGCWVWSGRPHRIEPLAGSTSVGAAVRAGGSPAAGGAATSGPAGGGPAASGSATNGAATSGGAASGAGLVLVVDVVGKVHRPGVYRLGTGARVQDAVTAAGGVLAGVDPVTVNLARKLTDGEQLVIGLPSASVPAASGPSGAAGTSGAGAPGGGPVDLNSATAEQLDALPGVGPVLAQRIVDWRTQHGHFDSVEQLQSVSGIGAAKYADLRPLVTVG